MLVSFPGPRMGKPEEGLRVKRGFGSSRMEFWVDEGRYAWEEPKDGEWKLRRLIEIGFRWPPDQAPHSLPVAHLKPNCAPGTYHT